MTLKDFIRLGIIIVVTCLVIVVVMHIVFALMLMIANAF